MVLRNGLEIQLVYADTKIPMKEFEKDGEIYVEAEPDADYFIATRRLHVAGPKVIVGEISVDGVSLGYSFCCARVESNTKYQGIRSRFNGQSINTAFRFEKPLFDAKGKGYRGGMGKAEIKLYEGVLGTATTKGPSRDFKSRFDPSTDTANLKAVDKKFVLTAKGKTEIVKPSGPSGGSGMSYFHGNFVDMITLNYCTALGLIEAGVLPKPDLWTHHRMKHPALPGQLLRRALKVTKTNDPFNASKSLEQFDLTEEADSTETAAAVDSEKGPGIDNAPNEEPEGDRQPSITVKIVTP
jgi:hypothetical protein